MADDSKAGIISGDTQPATLMSRIKDLRGKRTGIVMSIAAATVICSVILFYLPVAILGYIIIALVGFLLPYYFGVKRVIHILIYCAGLMVVLSFVFAGAYTHYVYLSPSTVGQDTAHNTTAGFYFKQGSVTPVSGNGATVFTFTAEFYHNVTNKTVGPSVPVYLVAMQLFANTVAVNSTMTPVANTSVSPGENLTTYALHTTLPGNEIYILQFMSNVSGRWVFSQITLSPWTSTATNTFVTLIGPSFLVVFLSIATLFLGVALIVLLIRRTAVRRDQLLKARQQRALGVKPKEPGRRDTTRAQPAAGKKEKFVCTSCGTEVGRDDTECPKCGEKFE